MPPRTHTPAEKKEGLHPRNRHRTNYDFRQLIRSSPALAPFVGPNDYGNESIDFSNPAAVKALNQALLSSFYGIRHWDLPQGYLCPPIPGRADYVHHVADLLGNGDDSKIPRGKAVTVLDIGIGASGVYAIIGAHDYGWSFVGTEIDPVALKNIREIVAANPSLKGLIEGRRQNSAREIFKGVVKPGETFALSICNPPFHASREEATAGTRRKVKALSGEKMDKPTLNFGGIGTELWCEGGEQGFIRRMIAESAQTPTLCRWFTTLVSKSSNLVAIYQALKDVKAADVRTIDMAQGQKKSRIVCWRFATENKK